MCDVFPKVHMKNVILRQKIIWKVWYCAKNSYEKCDLYCFYHL